MMRAQYSRLSVPNVDCWLLTYFLTWNFSQFRLTRVKRMDASTVGTIVEGIGNEVLITFLIGGVSCILALAWYSTHLTNSQTRLTAPTIHRSGVRLNRLPGSSTSEHRANNTVSIRISAKSTLVIFRRIFVGLQTRSLSLTLIFLNCLRSAVQRQV